MSNGDDVLDNWEEIDEVGLDSKLNKLKEERKTQHEKDEQEFLSTDETFFDRVEENESNATGFSRLQQQQQQQSSPLDDMSSFQNTVPLMMVLHKPDDEYQSANYMQPTKSQTVKILRRPTQSNEVRGNGMRPKQPIKTLQQREQEYAEARLRILGSAKNPEDDAEASSTSATKLSPMETSNNIYNNNSNANNNNATTAPPSSTGISGASIYNKTPASSQMVTSGGGSAASGPLWMSPVGVVDSTGFGGPPNMNLQSSQNLRQQQENVLRMPKGPDGSLGFQMRR